MSRVTRHSQSGVALIITVILLAVVTFMALTFLAITRRERGAVTTTTDTASARLAADTALASAEAQVVANVLATTNSYNFGLLVSTNYINAAGFNPGVAGYSSTNVSYYYANGNPVVGSDYLQLLANLYWLPRPPVFIQTNADAAYPLNFRYYLDLNRNGMDDPNGWWPELGNNGLPIVNGGVTNYLNLVGDPEWIGVLQHPDQPYGPDNPFVARYAFIAVPIGNALDLNHIYNQVQDLNVEQLQNTNIQVNPSGPLGGAGFDGFLRNQGVGSWEINLAAFLADLNTNEWGQVIGTPVNGIYTYYYYLYSANANRGLAFDDARALLAYRYQNNYATLQPAGRLFPNQLPFPNGSLSSDNIDEYSDGPLQITPAPINEAGTLKDNPNKPWAGAPNTNHFFSVDDLFDPNKANIGAASDANSFTNRLATAGKSYSTYDRYTYYRLLAQMGVDSAAEQDKINLNYSNAFAYFDANGVVTNIAFFPDAETNLTPWTPWQFFTIAADKMLRDYSREWLIENPSNYIATYSMTTNISTAPDPVLDPTNMPMPFGITDIPVLVSNRFVYSSAIQRVLQLAANMYDATTNNLGLNGNTQDYPSVFRPTFWVTNQYGYTNVYINGYQPVVSVIGTNDFQLDPPVDVTSLPVGLSAVNYSTYGGVNVYGVPWIIGAKKGFPNFNEFSMLTLVGITRKLEITRPSLDADLSQYQTNQMYILSISNSLGVECWNSYASNYFPSPLLNGLTIVARDNSLMMLRHSDTGNIPLFPGNPYPNPYTFQFANAISINSGTTPDYWPGSAPWTQTSARFSPYAGSFDIPLMVNVTFLTNSIYVYQADNPAFTYVAAPDTFIPAEQNIKNINNNYDYPDLGTPPLPQFDLVITNRLQVFMLDGSHVIDYVQFAGPDTVTNLNAIIADAVATNVYGGLWNTNSITGLTNGTPYGVVNQIMFSQDPKQNGYLLTANDNRTWRNPPGGGTVGEALAAFNAFLSPNHVATATDPNTGLPYTDTNTSLSVQVPFTPTRYVYGYTSWQANDPLVHYLASDLNFTGLETGGLETGWHQWDNAWGSNAPPTNLGKLNDRYAPWGWAFPVPAGVFADTGGNNLAYKDPLVRSSDDWDFPTYKLPTVGWLGRVHRGTPWQTIYLKATNVLQEVQMFGSVPLYIGTNTWALWTGDTELTYGQNYDAVNSAPVQDWLLFDNFTTALNDNATRGQLSVNVGASDPLNPQAGLAAWSALFSGVQTLSNNLSSTFQFQVQTRYQNPLPGQLPPSFTNLVINPAGLVSSINPPPLWQIVTNINGIRTNFVNVDGLKGTFEHVGDILAVPALSDQSPFLNWRDPVQQQNGISDEMYEWLPEQVMSLLRVADSPRYVIYCYGQALKPAPNGIYTGSGSYFGMVTNYQVMAAAATRAVVSFGSTVTNVMTNTVTVTTNIFGNFITITNWVSVPKVINNQVRIDQFNVLPPD